MSTIKVSSSQEPNSIQRAIENHPFRIITLFVAATILALGLYLICQAWAGFPLELKVVSLIGCGLFAIASLMFVLWPACKKQEVQNKLLTPKKTDKTAPIVSQRTVVQASPQAGGVSTPSTPEPVFSEPSDLTFSPPKRPIEYGPPCQPPSSSPVPTSPQVVESDFVITDDSYIVEIDQLPIQFSQETFFDLVPIIQNHHGNPEAMDYIIQKYQNQPAALAILLVNPLLPEGQEPDENYSKLPHKHLLDALRKYPKLLMQVMSHCFEKDYIPLYLWENMSDEELNCFMTLILVVPPEDSSLKLPAAKVWSLLVSLALVKFDSQFMNPQQSRVLRETVYSTLVKKHFNLLIEAFQHGLGKEDYDHVKRDMQGEVQELSHFVLSMAAALEEVRLMKMESAASKVWSDLESLALAKLDPDSSMGSQQLAITRKKVYVFLAENYMYLLTAAFKYGNDLCLRQEETEQQRAKETFSNVKRDMMGELNSEQQQGCLASIRSDITERRKLLRNVSRAENPASRRVSAPLPPSALSVSPIKEDEREPPTPKRKIASVSAGNSPERLA